jgi:A/G-specific adenine glycosylase
VDGNVERVVSRLFAVETPLPAAKPQLKALAAGLVADERPGEWAQALMDHGATICRPRAPLCDQCPVAGACAAFDGGDPERFPRQTARRARPRRHGVAWLIEENGRFALVQREGRGLLGGMLGLPTSEWRAEPFSDVEAIAGAPVEAEWEDLGTVEHVFTHFALSLRVLAAEARAPGWTVLTEPAGLQALPSLFLKAARLKLSAENRGARWE